MHPIYVLDTNIFIDYPNVISKIKNAQVVIPIAVIEEIEYIAERERFSSSFSAREAKRNIGALKHYGNLGDGIKIPKQNLDLIIITECDYVPLDENNYDNKILGVARQIRVESEYSKNVHLVTNDLGLTIKAESFGVSTKKYPFDDVENDKVVTELFIPGNHISELCQNGEIECDWILSPNQYVTFRDAYGTSQSAIARFNKPNNKMKLVTAQTAWDIKPKNREQIYAMDALMDMSRPVTVITGDAGCGKSFLSLAVAFELTLEQKKFKKIIVARPNVAIGQDIGFLPGDKDEKLLNWLAGITDNAELLLGSKDSFLIYMDKGIIELEALTYLRGRNLKDTFVIVDELQNSSPQDLKTILTRIADGSKIALLGDTSQIDTRGFNSRTCGLSYYVDKSKEFNLSTHIHMTNSSTRGAVASWAVKNL